MSAGGNEGRYATIRLPPLSAREACLLAEVLDTVLVALWDAHGDALAEWEGLPDLPPDDDPEEAPSVCGEDDGHDTDDRPF